MKNLKKFYFEQYPPYKGIALPNIKFYFFRTTS